MWFKVQLILLLFGAELYGHTLTKIQINNGTDVYEVNELPNKTVEFVNPKTKEPTLREIIYYRVIERPYITINSEQERITKESDREEPDFDETLRPFTNGQGYQFLDWGAQEENHQDDDKNTTVAANNNEKIKINDYYDEYDDKVNDDADVKTKGDITSNNNDDDYNSMEFDVETAPIKNHENDKDVYNDDYFDEEIDKKKEEKDKDDVFYKDYESNEKSGKSTKIDEEDETPIKANETVTNEKIDPKDKIETNDNHGKSDKKIVDDSNKKVNANHTDDIAMKLRSQLFNSMKEKYHNIKRHHGKPIIVNRSKREINYKNLPEAPVLPDLDLSVLPDYLQKMLKKRRNDKEQLNKNKEEFKYEERTTRKLGKLEDNLKPSNVDKSPDFDMKNKLKDMFDSIEDAFTKDGRKPRTYGMNLKGNTAKIWNDVAGSPSISAHDPKDNDDEVIGNPKNNEVDYDKDSAEEDIPSNNLNNEDLDYYGDMHSEEAAIKDDGTTEKPKELNINSEEADLPDFKIDHIEQIPRINKQPEAPASEEYARKFAESELPDVKIDHIEQIPRINKELDESDTLEDDSKLLAELPDLKIEHTEQIPRTYGKTSTSTIEGTTKKHEMYNKENVEREPQTTKTPETLPKKPSNSIGKESVKQEVNKEKLPINKNLQDKIEESFDNVIKQFKFLSIKQNPKAVDFDNIEGSQNNDKKSKTYGINLNDDHGYIWNPSSEVATNLDIDQDEGFNKTTENIKDSVKEQKEKDNELTTEDHKETINDENKEGIQDSKSVDKEKEINKKNETKLALKDLLKKDEFWKWLSSWTTTYMEELEERNQKFIKNEVARQLGQISNNLDQINKTKKNHNGKRNNEKANDKKTSTKNITEEIINTNGEHIHENNKTLPYNVNAETIYGSAVATDHVTNIFILYPETENNKSKKKLPVLDKDKSRKESNKISATVTFDERLGSNEDDELKETDDTKTKFQKNETTNNAKENSTKISNKTNKVSSDLKTNTTEANNVTTTESNTVITSINSLTTTEVYNSVTETTTGVETTTVIIDKNIIGNVTATTESSSKDGVTETTIELRTNNVTDVDKAVTTDATETLKADTLN